MLQMIQLYCILHLNMKKTFLSVWMIQCIIFQKKKKHIISSYAQSISVHTFAYKQACKSDRKQYMYIHLFAPLFQFPMKQTLIHFIWNVISNKFSLTEVSNCISPTFQLSEIHLQVSLLHFAFNGVFPFLCLFQ